MKTIKVKIFSALMIIISAATIFFACKKINPVNESPIPVNLVTASIAGRVTDLNNVPISNASVSAGTSVTTTDINGQFTIKNAQLNKDAGLVKITMTGYFNGSRTFLVNSNAVNNIKIQLIPKTVSGTFATGSGGSVKVLGGGSVSFNAGNVVRASNGSVFTGNVSVPTFYLNPGDANFNEFMPGDLRGISASNQQGILKVYGMALIEMDAASGEKLQLAAGNTATITLPIPPAMQANGPTTIPLWYFDDTTGIWKQQGSATKQGNNYVGIVSHFSFWTAGQLAQSVTFSATFTLDTSGIAYANKLVIISRPDSTTTNGYTDSTGTVSGLVPINEMLTMKVFNDCGENVYSQDIGPFRGDTVLGNISVVNNVCYPTDTSQYINLSFNGNNYFWPSFHIRQDFQAGSYTVIIGGSPGNLSDSSTYFDGLIFGGDTSLGSYPISLYVIVNGTVTYQAGGQSYDPTYAYPTTTITKYDAIGGYIEGNISGWIKTFPSIPTADSFPVTGNYRAKRIR